MQNSESSPHASSPDAAEKPFVIVLHQRDRTARGYFRPEASVTIYPTLRTSGLLLALPPEDVKSLFFLLTFVTPNGWCHPTLSQIAEAMRVSDAKVRARMQRLQTFLWQGQPLVTALSHDGSMSGFTLSPAIIALHEEAEPEPIAPPPPPLVSHAAIVAHSRALYARPRAEVEQMIAQQMGWNEEGSGPDAPLRRRLSIAGLVREQIDLLLERYPHERIERQLDWLPHRHAKSPARFLLAAIEHDYEAPPVIRLRQALAQVGELPEPVSADVQPNEEQNVVQGEAAPVARQPSTSEAIATSEEQELT